MDSSTQQISMSDHDLLIRVDTRLENVEKEMRGLRDGTKDDIRTLQLEKLSKQDFDQFKIVVERERLERMTFVDERYKAQLEWNKGQEKKNEAFIRAMYIGMTLLAVLEFGVPFIIKAYFHI